MKIILMDIANFTPWVIPITPTNYKVEIGGDNKVEDTITGKINIIKNAKLTVAHWSSIFPVKTNISDVSMTFSDGWLYVNFLKTMKSLRLPIRILVLNDNSTPTLNMLATIEDFSYSVDTAGDIQYSLQLKETPERIYEFILRDVEYLKNAGKYLKKFFTETGKRQKLTDAGLFIAQQKYK